jgi:hypothetical protein
VHFSGVRAVFPGDLTAGAWRSFLTNPRIRELLANSNIFMASHHGRQDGYSPEVFGYCKPAIVVVSDKSVMHATQLVDYTRHATGISWNSNAETRYCLTTRNDGSISITDTPNGGFWVQAG